jgi:hypothetical protein
VQGASKDRSEAGAGGWRRPINALMAIRNPQKKKQFGHKS